MKRTVAILFLSLLSVAAHADEQPEAIPADSLAEQVRIADVVVTGTRNRTDIRHLPMTVSVVGRGEVEGTMQPSLLPVLSEQVPGLFVTARGVMGYGVSTGGSGAISLRGLSGGAGRLMVLIDGHPQYMGIMGHPMADAYQSLMVEQAEVLRGPASVLYGSNAMGGVVNIVTRKIHEEGVKTDIGAGYGSYNTLQTELTNRVRKGRFTSVISGSYNRTDGHRARMGFDQYTAHIQLGVQMTRAWSVRADADLTHFNASNPGTTARPLFEARQHITRGVASVAIENEYERTSGAVSGFYNWGRHRINDGYAEGSAPLDYRFNSRDRMAGVSVYQSIRMFEGNRLTVGADYFNFGGEAWNKYLSGEKSPLVDKSRNEVAGYIDFRQNIGRWLTLDAGLRADWLAHFRTEWIPQFGLSFHLPRAVELKVSAGKGFRFPTIREMYMFQPQNPDLRAERMWNYEIAASQKLLDGRLSWGVNVFYIDGDNIILTVPNPSGSGRLNMNSGHIRNAGIEAQVAWRIAQAWSVDANYSYLHMENPVVASPEHKLYIGGAFRKGRWAVMTGVQYVGNLYTDTDSGAQEDFVLWNLRAQFRAAKWVSVWVRGDNLLAQRYCINAGYPMPRATVMGGVKFTF